MSPRTLTTTIPKQYSSTKVESHHLTHEWIIEGFALLPEEKGEYLLSSPFSASENDDIQWQLQLMPKGKKEDDIAYVSLFLRLLSETSLKAKIRVHCELSISNSNGVEWKYPFDYTFVNPSGYGFVKMIERSKLLKSCNSEDSITVRCKVDIPQRTITKSINPAPFDLQRGQMRENLSLFFGDSRFSDVVIIVEKEKFPAHRLILAARSPVFAAMFEHKEMEENLKNEVRIEDMEPETVRGMLEFIYTDEVTNLETLAPELLKASDKYELDRLRRICEKEIYETLSNDNAADIFILSDLYHSYELKEYVMTFIARHLVGVMKSEGYGRMMNTYPGLLNELMCSIAEQKKLKA